MSGRPDDFQPLSYLSLNQQLFIMFNVPEVQKNEQNTYVAMAVVAGITPEEDVYTNGALGQGQMQGTIDEQGRSAFPNMSWYQKTLVFIEQESGSNLQFQTYTPMIQSNLGMMSDGESNVVFQTMESDSNGITSIFPQDGDSYQWKTLNNTFLSLDTGTGNMKFEQAESSGSRFRFIEPPIVWEKITEFPQEFRPFVKLPEDRKELIKMNIHFPKEDLLSLFAARINVRNNEDGDQRLYVELQLEKANLKATTPNTGVDFKEVSWNQYYFVFAKKDDVSFEVFTPVAKHDLGLAIVGKTQSFSPSPPYGWTVFQFIKADNNYWYWKVKGEDLYLHCDPVSGDITATDDLCKRSQFSFLYDKEEEDQSDGKPPEQEGCKQEASEQEAGEQEASEQEAGRRRKMCKVQ